MVTGIILLIALVTAVFYIKRKIDETQRAIDQKMAELRQSPGDFAMDLGATMAAGAIKQVKKIFTR